MPPTLGVFEGRAGGNFWAKRGKGKKAKRIKEITYEHKSLFALSPLRLFPLLSMPLPPSPKYDDVV
jgi:hypothetical protein